MCYHLNCYTVRARCLTQNVVDQMNHIDALMSSFILIMILAQKTHMTKRYFQINLFINSSMAESIFSGVIPERTHIPSTCLFLSSSNKSARPRNIPIRLPTE